MDFETPAKRLGLELDEYMEIVELFLETGANDLSRLEDAIAGKDIQAVVERSHSLKGASGNLGLLEIYEASKEIENKARQNHIDDIGNAVLEIKKHLGNIKSFLNK